MTKAPRAFVALFLLGLLARVAGLPAWGTFDVEIQKAWAARAATAGVADIYGPADVEILAAAREAGGLLRYWREQPFPRTEFAWQGANYFVDYPPASVLLLWAEGRLYRTVSPEMKNRPAFNAAVNLMSLLGAIAIAWLLLRSDAAHGPPRSLAFWLNPAVILAAPFLGYQDTTFSAFALGSMLCLADRRWISASALLAVAILIKPQAALLLPIVAVALAREGRLRHWVVSAVAGLGAAAIVLTPWWLGGHLLSALDGCRRPLGQPTLAPLGLNVWWAAGYAMTWAQEGAWPLARIVTIEDFRRWCGIDARLVGRVALLTVTLGLTLWAWRRWPRDRTALVGAAILEVHAYALLSTSVHENHTFLAVILATLLLGVHERGGRILAAVSSFLLVNLLLMDGLGRRVTTLRRLEEIRLSTVLDLSVIVAVAHVGLVAWLCVQVLRRPNHKPGDEAGRARADEPT